MRARSTDDASSVKAPTLRRALVWAAVLILWDAFIANQGATAALVGIWIVFVALPLSFLRRFAPVRRQRLRNLGIYALAVTAVFALNYANNRLADARAELLISAVKAFHAKHQRYPGSLQELVPEFIGQVPVAKYTLMSNEFGYSGRKQEASLYYVAFPPFGRPTYSFATDHWGYLD